MSLNIKNEHVHQLARDAAARTGLSQTGVIEEALRLYPPGWLMTRKALTDDHLAGYFSYLTKTFFTN